MANHTQTWRYNTSPLNLCVGHTAHAARLILTFSTPSDILKDCLSALPANRERAAPLSQSAESDVQTEPWGASGHIDFSMHNRCAAYPSPRVQSDSARSACFNQPSSIIISLDEDCLPSNPPLCQPMVLLIGGCLYVRRVPQPSDDLHEYYMK